MRGANILVPIALAAFVPAAMACFTWLGPRRGMLASLLGGWLFLPVFDERYDLPFFHTKAMFVPGVLLAVSLLLDTRRWRRLRPRLLDAPMTALCVLPFAASLSNDLGAYDALSAAFEAGMTWGAPYLLGRLYLGEPGALSDLATALAAGALVYVPLCLWEIRMSPQLHRQLYGYYPGGGFGAGHMIRFGGYRPPVFMSTGLMLAMFMAIGTLAAYWMWRAQARRTLASLPLGWLVALLAVTTVLCKSVGAIVLLAAGVAVLEGTRRLRTSVLVLLLLAIPPSYCTARMLGWTGRTLVTVAKDAVNEERSRSIRFRLTMENRLMAKAAERPWLGWGRWGRYRVLDEEGQDISTTDGLWIIALGSTGISGLLALGLVLGLPTVLLLRRFPARLWGDPRLASATALAVACLLWAIDELLNSMPTPMIPAVAGALVSFCLFTTEARARRPGAARAHVPLLAERGPSFAPSHGP